MGCITGAAGGVIRDVLLNKTPVVLRQEAGRSSAALRARELQGALVNDNTAPWWPQG